MIRHGKPLRVLAASPLGRGGHGGIDRVMDNLAAAVATSPNAVTIDVMPTRGMGSATLMVPLMARFLARLVTGWMVRSVDLVHINVAYGGSVTRKAIVAAACRRLGVPYALHVHGSRFHETWANGGPAVQARMRGLIGRAARVIVLGTFWRDFVIALGADPARVVIVPNATAHPPNANVHTTDRPVRILFLGHMGERKGTPQLVEALAAMRDIGAWQATLGGNGEVETIRSRIADLRLVDRIDVLGWVAPRDVEQLQATHDILVLPSFNENLPMSVIEGMAHGMAVVATPVGAVGDLITDGESGLLVPPGDVPALANALRRCVKDAGLRAAMGARARAFHGANLDLAHYADRILAVWQAALSERPPR